MNAFLDKHAEQITGVLSCFDRMLFRGYLPIMSGASIDWPRVSNGYACRVNPLIGSRLGRMQYYCSLYESGGSVHQLQTSADNTEPTDTFMVVTGCNVNFDDQGNFINIMDAGWIESMVNHLAAEQGLGKVKYIHGRGSCYAAA